MTGCLGQVFFIGVFHGYLSGVREFQLPGEPILGDAPWFARHVMLSAGGSQGPGRGYRYPSNKRNRKVFLKLNHLKEAQQLT